MKVELLVRFANEGHYYNNIKIDPERIENVLPFSKEVFFTIDCGLLFSSCNIGFSIFEYII